MTDPDPGAVRASVSQTIGDRRRRCQSPLGIRLRAARWSHCAVVLLGPTQAVTGAYPDIGALAYFF
jgi:hypothetical protein